jgi:hypothetical protein
MTIPNALRLGVEALSTRKRMWVLFYAVTTLWAVAAVAPAMALLMAVLGESAWAARMAANFDPQFIAELTFGRSGGLPFTTVVAAGIAIAAVAAVAHLFLLGGAIALFCAREPFTSAAFFRGCGKHFWRFVRLALFAALFYVALMAVSRGLSALGNKIWGEGSVETPLVYWSWFRTVFVLALFGLVNLVFDYARIRLVADDSRKAFRGAMASVRFVFRNFGRTAGLYVLLWAVFATILAVYRGIAGMLAAPAMGLILLLFLVRQITVVARVGVQLLFYSSQSEMYLALAPPPVVVAEPLAAEPEAVAEPAAPETAAPPPAAEPEAVAEPAAREAGQPVAPPPEPVAQSGATTPEPER